MTDIPQELVERVAGAKWWARVSQPGEKMIDVARRLGVTSAEVSAIKHGQRPAPAEGPLAVSAPDTTTAPARMNEV